MAQIKMPAFVRLMRGSIGFVSSFSPYAAACLANYLWFRTQRFPEPRRETEILKQAQWSTLKVDGKDIQLYIWGEDNYPTVLLVHGWNARAAQLGSFAPELVEKGFRVIGFDAPGHGRSEGSRANLPEISNAIQSIERRHGSFYAAITHSFGGLCLMHALSEGVVVDKVSCISPAPNVKMLVDIFAHIFNIKPKVVEIQKRMLERRFDEDMWTKFSMPDMAKKLKVPGLLIHDKDDHDIPVTSSKLIAKAWENCELVLTSGLGHRRILHDKYVIGKVISYIG